MPDVSTSSDAISRQHGASRPAAASPGTVAARPRRGLVRQAGGWFFVATVAAAMLAANWHGLPDGQWLVSRQSELLALQASNPWHFACCLFVLMTVMCALALPGCSVVALAAGSLYGFTTGTAIVLLGSTLGATLAFLAARHLWRDTVRQRWGDRLAGIEAGLERDGAYYLFSLRVAPIVPFGLLNPLMGLSAMPTRQFFVVSMLGMAAGSAVYVYAGTTLAMVQHWSELFTPGLLAALLGLALLPWITRAMWRSAT